MYSFLELEYLFGVYGLIFLGAWCVEFIRARCIRYCGDKMSSVYPMIRIY